MRFELIHNFQFVGLIKVQNRAAGIGIDYPCRPACYRSISGVPWLWQDVYQALRQGTARMATASRCHKFVIKCYTKNTFQDQEGMFEGGRSIYSLANKKEKSPRSKEKWKWLDAWKVMFNAALNISNI